MGIRLMSECTRGQVDNENNNQSQYSNISNMVQGGDYIYKSESIAISNRNISEYGSEHRNAMSEHRIGTGTRIELELELGLNFRQEY